MNFLEKTPQILFVLLAFLASLLAAVITRDPQMMYLAATMGGVLGGVATGKPQTQQIKADFENLNVDTEK